MKVVITGATGFIGKALCSELVKEHRVITLTRRPEKACDVLDESVDVVQWDAKTLSDWVKHIEGSDVIVNLAGANVASERWTGKRKEEIVASRINATNALVNALRDSTVKPKAVIQASAIGFYGFRGDEPLDEASGAGEGFLAEVCQRIENISKEFGYSGIRTIVIRSGVVLGKEGGALPKMMVPFKFYLGGFWRPGSQWLSWITLADEIRAIKYLIENSSFCGVFNLTAPQPLTNRQFFEILAAVLKKPCWLPVPAIVLKTIFGKMADELFLTSQRVFPKRLIDAGFEFKYPDMKGALKAMKIKRSKS